MDTLLRDVRFAVRGLLRTPGFTAAAVIALALGIGATTAIFSVVDAVLLRSLGWGEESRLVAIHTRYGGFGIARFSLSVPELYDLREAPVLESFGAYADRTAALQGSERAERVSAASVTSGFFDVLGVHPRYGRVFDPQEDLKGNEGVALISAQAFRRRFGADPGAVGRSVTLDGQSYRIIGVLPESFSYGGPHEFFIPFGFTGEQLLQRGAHYLEAIGKLRAGVDLAIARKQIDGLSASVGAAHPDEYSAEQRWSFGLEPLRERFVRSSRQAIVLLFGAVLLVLLIACGNVANLLLARSAAREREFAVRAAMGAGRGRIVRQLLTEGVLLSTMGAAVGIALAAWGLDALLAVAPRQIRELAEVRLDRAVLGFSAGLTIATTLIFALVPALRTSRVDLATSLKDGGRVRGGVPAARLRAALVVAQVAICLFLLAGAGLMLRSFARLIQVSPGFDPEGALAVQLSPAGPAYDREDVARRRYYEESLRAAAALHGVQAAGGINILPTRGNYGLSYFIEGYEPRAGEPQPSDQIRRVLPGYFSAMRQPVLVGREFTAADDAKAPRVAMVNEAWARRYFPGRDVLGRRIRLDSKGSGEWRTIVGVAGDARERGLDAAVPPVYYFAAAQHVPEQMMVVVRGTATPESLRAALAGIDPSQPVDQVLPLSEVVARSLAARRFPLQLLAVFAALALVLSAVGIYGVTAYGVAQRTREIGVRMAIGASGASVVRMVLGGALRTIAIGLCVGTVGALAAGRLIASQLYGVGARDPLTYLVIAAVLTVVALAASAIPALRATRIDPMSALRTE